LERREAEKEGDKQRETKNISVRKVKQKKRRKKRRKKKKKKGLNLKG